MAEGVGGRRTYASGAGGGADTQGGVVTCEETSNKRLVAGLFRWWDSKQVKDKTAGLYSSNFNPRAFVASRDGKPELVVQTWEDFHWLCDLARSVR